MQPRESHKLPGKVEVIDGKTVQEGYGEWPECPTCHKQVEPALYSQHQNKEHPSGG